MATRIRLAIAISVFAAAASCSGYSSPTTPSTNGGGTPVTIMRNAQSPGSAEFTPGSVTIGVGSSVTWTNSDTVAHTATSDSGVFNGSVAPGAQYSYTFPVKGTFPYHCSVHPGMTGTVVVQ